MPRFDLYSKRQNDAAKSGQADVYHYDKVPSGVRIQIINIANSVFGPDRLYAKARGAYNNPKWIWVDNTYSHEKGIDAIGGVRQEPAIVKKFFVNCHDEAALDLIEVIAFKIAEYDEEMLLHYPNRKNDFAHVEEINYRLREAGMGYQFEGNRLTRVDSQLIHQEIVKPALVLLSRPGFQGAEEEFLTAHSHYRASQNKEAVAMAANALESTFKAVFNNKKWEYKSGARISDLIKVAKANGLWPEYLDNSFDQLAATLQNGLPKIRDNAASHGQGSVPKEVPPYLAAYALHLAASKIVFIVMAADAKA